MHDVFWAPLVVRHLERVEDQGRLQMRCHCPADDAAAEGVENYGQIEKASPRRNVGDVSHPELVRRAGGKFSLHKITCRTLLRSAPRRDGPRPPADAANAAQFHHPRDPLLADAETQVAQIAEQPGRAVRPVGYRVKLPEVSEKHCVVPRSRRQRPLHPRIESTWGDPSEATERRHRVTGLVIPHESERSLAGVGIVPVSRANQAAAFESISRSSLSCRFSRLSCLISCCSDDVRPSSLRPPSKSACFAQLRIVCDDGSNSFAKDSGVLPARTNSTSCSRNSDGYALRFDMWTPPPPKGEVSTEPGQLHNPEHHRHSFKVFDNEEILPPSSITNEDDRPTLGEVIAEVERWYYDNADEVLAKKMGDAAGQEP